MLVCQLYIELTCIPCSCLRWTLWVRSSALDYVCVGGGGGGCLHKHVGAYISMHVVYRADILYVCDQLSAQVVFMKLSENLFFIVVLDFDIFHHP